MFRKDITKVTRKPTDEIWKGDGLGIAGVVKYAPSACISQPWYVENQNGTLTVFRYKKHGMAGLLTPSAASYFNRIDIGIFLCILEICLKKNKITFERKLFIDNCNDEKLTKVAEYKYSR